jgi:hypothetical protein
VKAESDPGTNLASREAFVGEIATLRRDGQDVALSPLDFEPTDLPGLVRISELIARSPIAPTIYRNQPNTVLLVLWRGRERGLTVMRSIELIYPFDSSKGPQVAYAADLLYGLVERSGAAEYFMLEDSSATKATYSTQRKGQPKPVILSYTIEDAKIAGLLTKENWQKNPAAMLRARAKTNLARAVYGDVLAGLYTKDELIETAAIDVTPEAPGGVIEASAGKVIERAKRRARAYRAGTKAMEEELAGAAPGELLSDDQFVALRTRAHETGFGGHGENGWSAFCAWAAAAFGAPVDALPAHLYDELLTEINEDAKARAEGEQPASLNLEGECGKTRSRCQTS